MTLNGTTVVASHDDVVLFPEAGGTFSLIAFDLAGWPVNREVPFTVVANTGAVASFTPDGLVDGPGGVEDFETFTLPPGFEDVSSVTFIHTGSGTTAGIFHLDDIVVTTPTGSAPTPPLAPPSGGAFGGPAGDDPADP